MSSLDIQRRYGAMSIALHWIMLLLIAAAYLCIELRVLYPKGSDIREGLKTWHFMIGLTVFMLVWLRVIFRAIGKSPQDEGRSLTTILAKIVHVGLYVFMIVMPLFGWLMLSAEGKVIPFFGAEIPALIGPDKQLAGQIKEVHELIGTIGYVVIAGHAAAALFHHYVKRDGTLLRMLPRRR